MAQGENSLSHPASRRSFIKGLGAAGAGLTALPRWGFAEDSAAANANAAIDWKQFAGQTIALSGASDPCSTTIGGLSANGRSIGLMTSTSETMTSARVSRTVRPVTVSPSISAISLLAWFLAEFFASPACWAASYALSRASMARFSA